MPQPNSSTPLSQDDQFAALNILEFLTGLFTASGKQQFSREEVLVILDDVRSMEDLFDPDIVIAHQQAGEPNDDLEDAE